jgi:hypothetical protein
MGKPCEATTQLLPLLISYEKPVPIERDLKIIFTGHNVQAVFSGFQASRSSPKLRGRKHIEITLACQRKPTESLRATVED